MEQFDAAVFWLAFRDAGLLVVANVRQSGAPAKNVDVGLVRPGEVMGFGFVSTEYEIEYQSADLPKLGEGNAVTIGAEKFRVREAPQTQGDGFFSKAKLTKL